MKSADVKFVEYGLSGVNVNINRICCLNLLVIYPYNTNSILHFVPVWVSHLSKVQMDKVWHCAI